MSISSSLNAGVAGLAANATRLAAISDNISNSGTYGYKRVIADFEGMVINQARGAGVYSAGGVRASTVRLIDQRGTLVATSNPTDLAISGRGMLPVIPAASTSRLTIRPCGPDPLTADRSSPFSLAIRRARGEANTRAPPETGAAGAGAAAATVVGAGAALAAATGAAAGFAADAS